MLLKGKNVVIYGASDSVAGAVAQVLAQEGATLWLSNHRQEPAQQLADRINAAGGKAHAAEVDALDGQAISSYLDQVVAAAGVIDVSFNLIDLQDKQDIPLTDMELADFMRPIERSMRSQFLTATAAARHMMQQRSGLILTLTATPGGTAYPNTGGFGVACNAIEGFSRNLAAELGPHGVRAVNIRSAGCPDSRPFREVIAAVPEIAAGFLRQLESDTMLKQLPLMQDIANTALYLASALGEKITGTCIDVTCGTTHALNYKTLNIPFV
jgi:3-oxoacyl-[acyl-carrier protein] reductase